MTDHKVAWVEAVVYHQQSNFAWAVTTVVCAAAAVAALLVARTLRRQD
jgi:hypothetical protein